MSTTAVIVLYAPFAVITAVVFALELFRRFKRHEDYLFTVLCLCIAAWFALDIACVLAGSLRALRFLYNLKLIFVGFVPPVLLLFVLRFYKVPIRRHWRLIRFLLFAVPTANIAVALTSGFHSLLVDIEPAGALGFTVIWGPWFRVHTVQSYLVSVVIISVVVIRHFRLPRFYRLPSTLMSLGIFMTLIGNIITLLQLLPTQIDPTLITCSLSLILFDLAIINNNKSKFMRFSQKRIYHYLDEYILILDETRRVLEWNSAADNWFSSQGIVLKDAFFQDILDALLDREGAKREDLEGAQGSNIYLLGGDFPMVLNLHLHGITDAKDDTIGAVAVFSDITQTWALIKKLEEKAGVDSLTGIPNHMAYVGARTRFDVPEQLPLSVAVCDVNGLKQVNDTLGHQYGDLLLKAFAGALERECAAREYFCARTGGDEFILLMPRTPGDDAQQAVEQMQGALADIKQYPFAVSAAVGVATKCAGDEDLEDVIARADENMYRNKRTMKARGG